MFLFTPGEKSSKQMPVKVDEMTQHLGEVADQLKVFGEGMKEHMKLISGSSRRSQRHERIRGYEH
jgi:hypothetical protein